MRYRALSGGLVLALALAAAPHARAQDAQNAAGAETALAMPPEQALDQPEEAPPVPLTDEEKAALAEALNYDPMVTTAEKSGRPLKLPGRNDRTILDLSGTRKANGSGTMVLKPGLPQEWDAKVGADLSMPAEAPTVYPPLNPLGSARQDTGAAWASIGVPNLASVDARVDPANDQGKLATTFKQSIPVGRMLSLTLQNTYAVTGTYGQPTPQIGDLPLMALPQDAAGAPPSQVWSSEKLVKMNIGATGTTFGAGVNSSSTDPVMHNTLSAEQKLLGNFDVTTAVTDIGTTGVNKRVTAGFKLHW